MPPTEVILKLPAALAEEARDVGLLDPESLARLLREELQRRRAARFFDVAEKLASDNQVPMSADEIEAEIAAVRKTRRVPQKTSSGCSALQTSSDCTYRARRPG